MTGTEDRIGSEGRGDPFTALSETLGRLTDELERQREEFSRSFRDIHDKLASISDRLDAGDERLDNMRTDIAAFRVTGANGYQPARPEYTPSGRAFSEPKKRWVRDHPYRR